MKQNNLLTTMLLLFALIVGSTSAWAEDKTITLDYSSFGLTTSYAEKTATVDDFEFTVNQGYKGSGNVIQMNSTKGSGILYNTTPITGLKSITVNVSSGNKTYTITTGTSEKPTANSQTGTTGGTYNALSGDTYFQLKVSGASYFSSIVITYDDSETSSACVAPTFSPAAGTYTSAQSVTLSTTTEDATIYYTTDGNDPTTNSSVYSSAISVTETMTIKAMAVADGYDNSSIASATYTIVNLDHTGTVEDPYSVADAIKAIDAGNGTTGIYVKGIVCEGGSSLSNGAMNYWISDDGTTTNKFEIYKGKGIDGANFTSTDEVQEGDVVVVYGDIKLYSGGIFNTYEFDSGSQLVSLDRPTSTTPVITASGVTINYDATSGEIEYSITNPADGVSLSATTQAEWISNIAVADDKVTFTTTANEGTADRTATITLSYTGATAVDVTVTQKHYVKDYAELPFSFDSGKSGIESVEGLTQDGLGSDYSSSPKLKFDGTGDYVVLHFNERPGILTFDIKGNSFSGGTFTVQTSEDGVTYTDLKTYTSLSNTQSEVFENLGENVRYIKWIYTEKSNGNVALGNIVLAKYEVPGPSITVESLTVDAPADGTDGTLTVTYNNITNVAADVTFYEADGTTEATYDWVDAEIDNEGNVYYVIGANEGASRTAYLKVYGTDGTNEAYSDLITITQAAYVAPPVPSSWVAAGLADINANDVFVIVGDNGDTYAMSNDKGTGSAPTAVEVTVTGNTLSGEIADNIQWNISGDATDGYTFYPNGTTETWLYCTNTNNGVRVGTNDNNTFVVEEGYLQHVGTSRYVGIYNSQDWRCYTSYGVNIAGQTFTFYKKLAAKLNDYGYATFSATVPVDFSEATDFTAWAISSISGTTITFEQVTGAVPANTGVLLKGTAGSTVYPLAATAGTTVTNKLEAITTATAVTEGQYYGLSGNTFVPVSAGTVPAGKALLPANEVSGARQLTFVFGSETTGIRNLTPTLSEGEGVYYNLAGQRVAQPTKGLYIVNGKKYMVK